MTVKIQHRLHQKTRHQQKFRQSHLLTWNLQLHQYSLVLNYKVKTYLPSNIQQLYLILTQEHIVNVLNPFLQHPHFLKLSHILYYHIVCLQMLYTNDNRPKPHRTHILNLYENFYTFLEFAIYVSLWWFCTKSLYHLSKDTYF